MDLFEAIYTRRTIRKFLSTPVEFDKIVEVIKAGANAPSAGDLQNWKFIVVTDPNGIKSMYNYSLEQEAFMTATAAIIVCGDVKIAEEYYGLRGSKLYTIQSCAAAIENMLLAAHALGLGACWIGAFDEDKIRDVYDIPDEYRPQAIVLMGYPDETPKEKVVNDVWWLTYFNKFGNKFQYPHRITHDLSVEWEVQAENAKRFFNSLKEDVKKSREDKKKVKEELLDNEDDEDSDSKKKGFKDLLKKLKRR